MKNPGENEVARRVCPVFDWRTNTSNTKKLLVTPVGLQIEVASSHQTWLENPQHGRFAGKIIEQNVGFSSHV
jgi:hypothetical protein